MKPTVFIGSSLEAKKVADGVLLNLRDYAEVTTWNSAFRVGEVTIEKLRAKLANVDFGVFIFAPDDPIEKREKEGYAPRDNVVLELGMMIAMVGQESAFIIKPDNPPVFIPTDLLGVVTGRYEAARVEKESKAATEAACVEIREAMEEIQRRKQEAQLKTNSAKLAAMNSKVTLALEAICRAMSVPVAPFEASLRAFVFQYEKKPDGSEYLVCRHMWDYDDDNSPEEIGTPFRLSQEFSDKIVVVRCFVEDMPANGLDDESDKADEQKTEAAEVGPLPPEVAPVKPNLSYVLAAPIRTADGQPWGVVDFDASNEIGKKLLEHKNAKKVIRRLAKHLGNILSV